MMRDDFLVQIKADALFDCGDDRLSDQDGVGGTDAFDMQDLSLVLSSDLDCDKL